MDKDDTVKPGDIVILDETKLPGDVEAIPVWNLIHNNLIDRKDPAYIQVDYVFYKDIVLVLSHPLKDGSVNVLTSRGKIGISWFGHLRKFF